MKAVLVMDMPECCIDCPCHFVDDPNIWCGATKRDLETNDIEIYKPDWCPLKPLPEKQDLGEQAVKELVQEIKYSSIPRESQEVLLKLVNEHLVNTNTKTTETYIEEGRQCPKCGSYETKVVDNRYFKKWNKHLRKRKCQDCGRKWYTEEVVVQEV